MELRKLDCAVLKLWYTRALIWVIALLGLFTVVFSILKVEKVYPDVITAISVSIGVPIFIIICFILILPYLKYKMFLFGYDDKKIIVKQGVIFKKRVVIPVCQIQDLHRFQGPIMMLFKLSGVTISTAGSNFEISTLTTVQADAMIDELEKSLEARIKELGNEEI